MYKALRGMDDILSDRIDKFNHIINIASSIAINYGFEMIETPKLECSELFRRSVGESSDVVNKEMYEFLDKSDNLITLRPEGTAGVVRSFIQNKFDKSGEIKKFFYYGSMFRYERPQKGRFREFHQFGVESFGINSYFEDANIILLAAEILNKLEIPYKLKINSLGSDINIYKQSLISFLDDKKDLLCDDCKNRLITNPLRVLDCKNKNCQEILSSSPKIIDFLSDEDRSEFDKILEILSSNNIDYEIDPHLVRGLDYYTKTAFEFIYEGSAIIGGGRYDKLIQELGGKMTPAIGFGMGIERIADIISPINNDKKLIYICALDEKFLNRCFDIGINLRKIFKTNISYDIKNLGKHLKSASKLGANIFLCIGDDEFKNDEIWYKNLDLKDEKTIQLRSLLDFLKEQL